MSTMTIRTPSNNYTIKKNQDFKKDASYFEEIQMQAVDVSLGKLAAYAKAAVKREIAIVATFFQRVVARTPIDERYAVVRTKKDGTTETTYHEIDTIVCQDDWYITDGKRKITAGDMKKIDGDLFWNVNEKYSIEKIKKIIQQTFDVTPDTNFEVGNDNPHFELLENGNKRWFNDGLTAGKSRGKTKKESVRREHGVKNKHSIQAPVGMMRISLAELDLIRQSAAESSLASRYRPQIGRIQHKLPNKGKLKDFSKLLEKRSLKYSDIEEYLEKY